ncbi:MAG: TatD family hydrolase [Clostridiales bacterium]|nr:TatD family hydrolase [Clostridiales bacterium]
MIFDTHSHYDDEAFDSDRNAVLTALHENGIGTVVNVGADIRSSKRTLALTRRYPFVYGSVGVHPKETAKLDETQMDWLRQAAGKRQELPPASSSICDASQKIVAIGEIGLDYHWDTPERSVQKYWFIRQLALAREVSLPVILHSRDAAKDTLDIIQAEHAGDMGGVVHCFSYSVEIAREYLKMGFYLGIGGVLTYRNARRLREVVAYMPIERLVLETDCPYLAPEPFRGQRNTSQNLPYVVKAISEIKKLPEEEIIAITERNAKQLYRLG